MRGRWLGRFIIAGMGENVKVGRGKGVTIGAARDCPLQSMFYCRHVTIADRGQLPDNIQNKREGYAPLCPPLRQHKGSAGASGD